MKIKTIHITEKSPADLFKIVTDEGHELYANWDTINSILIGKTYKEPIPHFKKGDYVYYTPADGKTIRNQCIVSKVCQTLGDDYFYNIYEKSTGTEYYDVPHSCLSFLPF